VVRCSNDVGKEENSESSAVGEEEAAMALGAEER
jgi:hypothetical protein